MKKFVLALLASAFVIGAVAACGEKKPEDKAKDAVNDTIDKAAEKTK